MPKVLIVSNGAREHALASALKRGKTTTEVYCFANAVNPGIQELATDYKVGDILDFAAINQYIEEQGIDFVIPGPEAPICAGITDALKVPCLAPKQYGGAQLEGSKAYTRELMTDHDIPGLPKYRVFTKTDISELTDYIQNELHGDYVVKYDSLKGGKGVKVSGDHLASVAEGVAYAEECLQDSDHVVIEEKLVGQEFSLIALCDGETLYHFPAVQDHKRAFDGDKGPNTGGMGSYTDVDHSLPFLTKADIDAAQGINKKIIAASHAATSEPFIGILFGGFILTKSGVKVIEYNTRFGDPEAENLLTLFNGDFTALCQAALSGELSGFPAQFCDQATVCLYAVPEGYPTNSVKGQAIEVPTNLESTIYFAAVDLIEKSKSSYKVNLLGSRAVAVVGQADTVEGARQQALADLAKISGPVRYRSDIASKEVLATKVEQMQMLRS